MPPAPAPVPAPSPESDALGLDCTDPLAPLREKFCIPRVRDIAQNPAAADEPCVYLCGNSLGLMPKGTPDAVNQELDDWRRLGVEAHFHGAHPWLPYHEELRGGLARLVGAMEHEVVAMNSLTVNLHLMMASFYRPTPERFRIVIEDSCFPSDSYAVQSQAAWHGYDPARAVLRLTPRPGEHTLRTEDVLSLLASPEGRSVAMVMLGGVNYLSGQVMDMAQITRAGQAAGAVVGWDLAHAAGNVPLRLHDWNADFACWCSYKYLNSGPGALAGCFVHERHTANTRGFDDPARLPRLAGWWGNDPAVRFRMGPEFVPVASADAWQLSNPPILAAAPLRVSLGLFDSAGMDALRGKSLRLTGYLRSLIAAIPGADRALSVITPDDPSQRGCQLSLMVRERPRELHAALIRAGVVCDYREPGIVRVSPVPMYNSFHDCWRFAAVLRTHIA